MTSNYPRFYFGNKESQSYYVHTGTSKRLSYNKWYLIVASADYSKGGYGYFYAYIYNADKSLHWSATKKVTA